MVKKVFFIVVPIIAITALIFVFGIQLYNNSFSKFQIDGFVIDADVQKKVYFSQNDKYKIVEKLGYVELTSDKEEKKVSDDSFVHYVDGSISTFKKAVFLDLDTINKNTFQYYNIFPTSILSNVSEGYRINYLENNLNLKNILMKISSTRYLIAGDKIEVTLKNGNTKVFEHTFLEISYLDGNIIRLDNQDISIQSVSSELILKVNNDISVDLINKKILYKNTEKINLGEITINSNDNIEIIQSEENTKIIDEEKEKKNLPKITDGRITVKPNNDVEEIVDENAQIRDAIFSVLDFEVDANSIKANIYIEDKDGILSGDKIIQIIKSGTNEIVYNERDSTGRTSILLDVETLSPDTNYTLIVNQNYIKNDIEFNKDFVQKAFVTSSLGIEVNKDYARENELGIMISKKSFSNVSAFEYALTTITGEIVKSGTVQLEDENYLLSFQQLMSNTKYKFTITNFLYENIMVGDNYQEQYVFTTLKKKPTVGASSFSVDKQNSKFVLSLNNIKDQDNGITSYRADIYENDNMVISKAALPSSRIDIFIDDEIITRHTDYRAYMYLIFNDNEKEYEIPIGSNVMNMNASNRGPIVRFVSDNVTWERIVGNIYIEDKDKTIDNTADVIITYQNLTISTDAKVLRRHNLDKISDEEYILPVDVNGLKANDTYLFTVKALVNYNDENGFILADIGQFLVQTAMPKTMAAEFEEEDTTAEAFSVNMRLKSFNDAEDTLLEASTMEAVTIKLYKSGFDTSLQCIAENGCWSTTLYDENNGDYESTLKDELYFPNTNEYYNITPSTLNIKTEDLEYAIYNLEITDAKDYTSYKNNLPIVNNVYSLTPSNVQQQIINNNAPLKVTPIKNNGSDSTLKEDTYIGYQLTPNLLLTQDMSIRSLKFSIYDAMTDKKLFDIEKNSNNNYDISVEAYFDESKNFIRGGAYYVIYSVNVIFDGNELVHTSERSMDILPLKEEPTMDIYLVTRDRDYSYWKYRIKDIDNAVLDNSIYYYFGTDTVESIPIIKKQNAFSSLSIPTSSGKLSIFRKISLNTKSLDSEIEDVSFYFAPIISSVSNINYSISTSVNQLIINFDFDDIIKNNVIFADVEFIAGSKRVLLEKLSVDSKKVIVDYYEIKELKGLGDISCSIKLYYDSNIYGLENVGLSSFQDSNEKYILIDNSKIFTYNAFIPDTNNISISISGNNKNIPYVSSKGYIVYETTMGMFKKIELSSTNDVYCNENCTFRFDNITPSLALKNSDINVGLMSVNFNASISGYDDEMSDSMIVHAVLRKMVDNVCDQNIVVSKNIPLYSLGSNYSINGLERGTNYCMNFYWSDSSVSNQKFYYSDTESYDKTYNFKTLSTVNISEVDLQYVIFASSVRGRYLNASFHVGLMEGYSGIKYQIKRVSTSEIVVNNIYTSIDEIQTLNGNVSKYIDINGIINVEEKYNVEIIPYIVNDGIETEFDSSIEEFVLKIDSPKIVFTRLTNVEENSLSFKINIRDSSNALNRYRVYDLYYKDDTNPNSEPILVESEISASNINKRFTISCPSMRCSTIVRYREDITNTGEYVLKQVTKAFNLSETFLLGEVTIVQNSNNSIITLGFMGSYNLKEISKLVYTIVDENGSPVSVKSIERLNFVVDPDNDNYTYLNINENLNPGKYQLVLQFISGVTGKVSSIDLSYIKT